MSFAEALEKLIDDHLASAGDSEETRDEILSALELKVTAIEEEEDAAKAEATEKQAAE